LSQQTLSAQNPFMHSEPMLHISPFGLRPHELFTQLLPAAHCVLSVQVAQQTLASLHLNGAHGMAMLLWQTPRPSHLNSGVKASVLVSQREARQTVPTGYRRQEPLPSQVPSF